MMPTIHSTDSSNGCRAGNPLPRANPTAELPHRSRTARTIELIGFQSATFCSTLGSVLVGMNALDRKVNGKIQMKPALCATSTLLTLSPIVAEIQLIA